MNNDPNDNFQPPNENKSGRPSRLDDTNENENLVMKHSI